MGYFQKISGYKVISKCRGCGARLVDRVEVQYCEKCRKRFDDFKEEKEKKKKEK